MSYGLWVSISFSLGNCAAVLATDAVKVDAVMAVHIYGSIYMSGSCLVAHARGSSPGEDEQERKRSGKPRISRGAQVPHRPMQPYPISAATIVNSPLSTPHTYIAIESEDPRIAMAPSTNIMPPYLLIYMIGLALLPKLKLLLRQIE